MGKTLLEMAAGIIQAQSSSKSMDTDEITAGLQTVYAKLQILQNNELKAAEPEEPQSEAPNITPDKSILKNKIVCLECGNEFKMLSSKHLAAHSLTPREYRLKYGFKLRQPLCCKTLSIERKKAGKARGIPENLKKSIAAKKKKARKPARK
ncbi:hypothetical protein MNBD_DELTA03-482 [hydrothermal vent metagenome]|uniref:Transcriptional regulator n=1 Tax=hydrothermal vent metagenome TaxID=652676 RepID=A0A3B0VJQ2_9ZZZZ